MRGHERAPAGVRDRPLREVDVRVQDLLARAEEVPAPAVRVEADDVVRKHALVDVPPDRAGEDAPGVALRPRDVDKVAQRGARGPLADEPRREVEVVVVQEERGVGVALELLDRGRGEGPVDGDVPVAPGALQLVVDVRGACQRPEVVLEEPQRRIGDHVVEALVGQLVVGDETQAVARAVARGLVDRSPGLLRHEPVLVGHRARDPGHLVVRDEAAQRRHEPAAAAPHDPPPRVVARRTRRARGWRRRSASGAPTSRLSLSPAGGVATRPSVSGTRRPSRSLRRPCRSPPAG